MYGIVSGQLLRAFFARSEAIKVRHRFFSDVTGLRKWCQELSYLAEPVVLVLASHGSGKGISVGGKTIGAAELAKCLSHCDNLKLLHFSSCQVLRGNLGMDFLKAMGKGASFPVSGYATTVDWAASAIIEFMYLDYILMRGKSPATAAAQMKKLLPFAGDRRVPGTSMPAAGFRLIEP